MAEVSTVKADGERVGSLLMCSTQRAHGEVQEFEMKSSRLCFIPPIDRIHISRGCSASFTFTFASAVEIVRTAPCGPFNSC